MTCTTQPPLVSIIIRNYNGVEFIERCLNSVLSTDYPNYEVIFIDNGSTDGSPELVERCFGPNIRLKIVRNKENLGIAKANNIGANIAKGKYLVFLDNDTEVDSNWITELVKVMETDSKIGAAQSKLLSLRKPNTIDCAGVLIDRLGMPYIIGHGETDVGQYDRIYHIFCAVGNALALRREVFVKVGFFDPEFFIHLEDDDICWRIWQNGYRVVFAPRSIVFHLGSGALSKQAQEMKMFYLWRNMILMLMKNYEMRNLLPYLLVDLTLRLAGAIFYTMKGNVDGIRVFVRVIRSVMLNLRKYWRKRLETQYNRKIRDGEVKKLMLNVPVFVYVRRITQLRVTRC